MIEFKGNLSTTCTKFYQNRDFLMVTIIVLLAVLPFVIPILVASILEEQILLGFSAGIILILPIVLPIIESSKYTKKKLPTQIIIADGRIDKISILEPKNNPINEVETVVDYGEWYQIYFNIGFRNNYVICQKNLIVQGTIEEFEKLFEDKLVRKIKLRHK